MPTGGFVASVPARAADDFTVEKEVTALKPGTRYYYAFAIGLARSAVGRFVTAPAPGTPARVRFAISGDADATPGPNGKPGFNRFEIYGRMAAEQQRLQHQPRRHDLLRQRALRIEARPHRRRQVAEVPLRPRAPEPARAARICRAVQPVGTTTSSSTTSRVPECGEALYQAGVKAFTDYAPVSWTPQQGFYRTFRWGKNLELFFLDERSFRSAKARGSSAATTSRRPLPPPCGPRSRRSSPRSPRPCRRRASTRSTDPARTLLGARPGSRVPEGDSRRRPRPSRSSSTRCRCSSSTNCPTTAGRATPPSGRGSSRPRGREERRLPDHRHAREPDR